MWMEGSCPRDLKSSDSQKKGNRNMMNMPLEAEMFGEIPISTLSQCVDIQALFRMDTKELLATTPSINETNSAFNIDELLNMDEYPNASCVEPSEFKPLSCVAADDHWNRLPELSNIMGTMYNFNVEMKGQECNSSSWCYSASLNKLYVKKKNSFTVDVSYRNFGSRLTLRVMLVCSAPHEAHKTITRCRMHDKDHAQSDGVEINEHVVRCVNPTATYTGKVSGVSFGDRLSMVIDLHGVGEQLNTPVSLEFLCQNSCPTIERRATSLIFTLENEQQMILGRKSFNVKICSCPKRDMSKEEGKAKSSATNGKRKRNADESSTIGDQQPPRKLTRQSSLTCGLKTTRSFTTINQRDAPVPSTSEVSLDYIKKEAAPYIPVPISRSSSAISTSAVENDNSAIVLNLRLPDIPTAVEVVEYAFKHMSADMLRCGDDEKRNRLGKFLAHCRRVKSKYSQFL